jgi:hypothetical protein
MSGQLGKDFMSTVLASSFFLPLVLICSDCLHVLFNVFQEVVDELAVWKSSGSHFATIATFPSQCDLRNRFVESCLSTRCLKHMFNSWSINKHFNWKWQYLQYFVDKLEPLLHSLQTFYTEAKMRRECSWNAINAKIIDEMALAMSDPLLHGLCLILQAVSAALGRVVGWLEGCRCHSYLLKERPDGPQSYRKRLAEYRKACKDCPYGGRRAVEFIAGGRDYLLGLIEGASTPKLRNYIAAAEPARRVQLVAAMAEMKMKICSVIRMKTQYMFVIPHYFLGCLAHVYADKDISYSRVICQQCIVQRDQQIASGNSHKIDNVTIFLCIGRINPRRVDLEKFQHTGELGVHAHAELKKYS